MSSQRRFGRHPSSAAATVDDETVVMSGTDHRYHALNGSAARLWYLLDTPRSVTELVGALKREFDVDEDRCRRDVAVCLEAMVGDGIVTVVDESPPS